MRTEAEPGGRTLLLEEEALRARLKDVRANIARLQVLERQLITALGFFDTDLLTHDEVQLESSASDAGRSLRRKTTGLRQRAMISAVLQEPPNPDGLMAIKDIIATVADRYGVALVRTSVSPTLRKMEQAGQLDHLGRRWRWRQPPDGVDDAEATVNPQRA